MSLEMLIRGDLVHFAEPGQLKILRDHVLVVNNSGFIEYVGSATCAESIKILADYPNTKVLLPVGTFLVPSFCDLHLHAPQFLYQGTGLHLPLMEWLNEYAFKAEERLDADPKLAELVYERLAQRLAEHGTGAVLLFGTIKEETNLILAKVMQSHGIRAFVGKLSMDISSRPTYVEESAEASLAAARSFAENCTDIAAHLPAHQRVVEPVLTPRFVPTCSDALLTGLGELAESKGLRIQSHMAEAHDQVSFVLQDRSVDDIDVFARSKLLTPRTIQAHCTFLDPSSLTRVANAGTAIAHCPLSNAYFSAEPFRLREALERGTKVGLGTDVAGGYSLDIMNSMRQAVALSRMREGARIQGKGDGEKRETSLGVDWKEAMYLATHGGAIALGLAEGSGTFTVGAPFDAQCIQVFHPHTKRGVGELDFLDGLGENPQLTEEMVEKWWCLGDTRNRTAMWVQGRKVTDQH